MNLVGDVNKAKERARKMSDNFATAKNYSDKFNEAYASIMNLVG